MATPTNQPPDTSATTGDQSMSNATHGNAKALFGILFIQYCSYAFFYIMDHIQGIYPEHFTLLKFPKEGQAEGQQQKGKNDQDNEDDDDDDEGDDQDSQGEPDVGPGHRGKGDTDKARIQQQLAAQNKQKQQNVEIERIDEDDDDSEEEDQNQQQQRNRRAQGGRQQYEGGQRQRGNMSKQKDMQRQIEMQKKQGQQQQRGRQQESEEDDDEEPQRKADPKINLKGLSQKQMQESIKNSMKEKIQNDYEYAFAKKISDAVKKKAQLEDMTEEELEAFDKWEKGRLQSISNQIVEYFPQIMIWHTMIVSICAIRSPVDFAVSCTLFSMLMRIVMVFGFYCNKKMVYIAASGLEIFCNFCLLFIALGYSQYA